jgi:hypothetical protein
MLNLRHMNPSRNRCLRQEWLAVAPSRKVFRQSLGGQVPAGDLGPDHGISGTLEEVRKERE